ncbi:Cytochrome b561 and DOMON domain-containing protein At4g17280 [Linum perenne]
MKAKLCLRKDTYPPFPTLLTFIISFFVFFTWIGVASSHFHQCNQDFLKMAETRHLTNCKRLNSLRAELAWKIRHNYNYSHTNNNNKNNKVTTLPPTVGTSYSVVDFMFGTRLTDGLVWVAWGVNPGKKAEMVGTRALIGVVLSNGSFSIATYNLTLQTKMGCGLKPSPDTDTDPLVQYRNPQLEYLQEIDYFIIRATVLLRKEGKSSFPKMNHVWQVGYDAVGMDIRMHPSTLQHVDSTESLDLVTLDSTDFGDLQRQLRMAHGILNIIGWGILLPVGAIMVRYMRYPFQVDENWWFYTHLTCQLVGYCLGTAGWILGLYLGNASTLYTFQTHRLYSIFIFTFATLQVLAVKLRPRSMDEYKRYWNMYHHFLGYSLLAVIVINIFHGIAILSPDYTWKWTYIGILVALALIVLTLETYTWIKFYQPDPPHQLHNNNNNNNNNLQASGSYDSSRKSEHGMSGPSSSSVPLPTL